MLERRAILLDHKQLKTLHLHQARNVSSFKGVLYLTVVTDNIFFLVIKMDYGAGKKSAPMASETIKNADELTLIKVCNCKIYYRKINN